MVKQDKGHKEASLAQQAQFNQKTKDASMVEAMKNTEAGAIWNEIKDRDIAMFSLPDQKVHMHCHPVMIEPSKLYLLANSSAVLPSLEMACGGGYVVEMANKFITVSRVQVPITETFGKK